jgi:hypothetical protein
LRRESHSRDLKWTSQTEKANNSFLGMFLISKIKTMSRVLTTPKKKRRFDTTKIVNGIGQVYWANGLSEIKHEKVSGQTV